MRVHNSIAQKAGEIPLGTKWPQKKKREGNITSLPCEYCDFQFTSSPDLASHIRSAPTIIIGSKIEFTCRDQHSGNNNAKIKSFSPGEETSGTSSLESSESAPNSLSAVAEPISGPGMENKFQCSVCFKVSAL